MELDIHLQRQRTSGWINITGKIILLFSPSDKDYAKHYHGQHSDGAEKPQKLEARQIRKLEPKRYARCSLGEKKNPYVKD